MAQFSSQSDSSSHGGSGGGYNGQGSPVAYRIGPLAYETVVYYKCKPPVKACRCISWSNGQLVRRYYRCRRARTRGDCGFFRWLDDECTSWYKEVLGDLRDAVWELKKLNAKKEEEMNAKDSVLVAKQMELEEKKQELEEKEQELEVKNHEVTALQQHVNGMQQQLDGKQQALEDKEQAVQALKSLVKNKNHCIDMLVVLSVLLVIGMVAILINSK